MSVEVAYGQITTAQERIGRELAEWRKRQGESVAVQSDGCVYFESGAVSGFNQNESGEDPPVDPRRLAVRKFLFWKHKTEKHIRALEYQRHFDSLEAEAKVAAHVSEVRNSLPYVERAYEAMAEAWRGQVDQSYPQFRRDLENIRAKARELGLE